jgi:hypothetical protein
MIMLPLGQDRKCYNLINSPVHIQVTIEMKAKYLQGPPEAGQDGRSKCDEIIVRPA